MAYKTKDEAITALIDVAEEEIGYLEKKSNSNLDSKTGNAGSANYTKYWRDVYPSYQAQAWCACFVSWCFMKAFGLELAKKLLKHWPYVYCPTLGNLFTQYTTPQKGDIVIFYRNGTFAHTGLVTKVSGSRFWTIEGNTFGASGIIANGGGVREKSYYTSNLPGTKFCRPDYSIVVGTTASAAATTTTTTTTGGKYMFSVGNVQNGSAGNDVKLLQRLLRSNSCRGADGKKLSVDGECGANTTYAIRTYQARKKLTVDGECGQNTWKSILLR